MSQAPVSRTSTRLLILAVWAALFSAGCGRGHDLTRRARPRPASPATDPARVLEESATEARNALDSARRSAEEFLTAQAAPTRREAESAREKARRALRLGSIVLGQAADDGSRTAEDWARVIQDRMMRLEETLDHLTGVEGHADS